MDVHPNNKKCSQKKVGKHWDRETKNKANKKCSILYNTETKRAWLNVSKYLILIWMDATSLKAPVIRTFVYVKIAAP